MKHHFSSTPPLPLAPLVPCPNLYVQLNALQLVLDPRSLVWINLFALDLKQSLEQFMEIYKLSDSQKPEEHVDIKVDGLMLKVGGNAERCTRQLLFKFLKCGMYPGHLC